MNLYTFLHLLTDPLSLLLLVGMGGALIGLLVAHWLEREVDDEPHGMPTQLPSDYQRRVARFHDEDAV